MLDANNLVSIYKTKAGISDGTGELAQLENVQMLGEALKEWLATADIIVVAGKVAMPTPPAGGALPVEPNTNIGSIR